MHKITMLFVLAATMVVNAMPSLPDDVKHAVYTLYDNEHYALVREYIATTASFENLAVLDLFLEGLIHPIETVKIFQFSYRNAIVASVILTWGACVSFAKNFGTSDKQNPLATMKLFAKCKAFFGSYGTWMLKKGIFVALLTSLPSIFAEFNYYTHHYKEQEARIAQLRYEITMRYVTGD